MQIQPSPPDPHLHTCDKKVNMLEAMATPSRWLPRSASARADPPSPFSSNPAHNPVSTPTTPSASSAAAASSFGCMTATPTDTPPATPRDVNKTKAAPEPLSAAAFAAFWNPRRLMQRAARVFRSSRSRRRMKLEGRDEPAPPVTGRVSDAASAGSMDVEHGSHDGNNNNGAAADDKMQEEEQQQQDIEIVPEKIIHVANHHQPSPVVKETEAVEKTADEKENGASEKEMEEPKKAGAVPAPEAVADNVADMADKFCMVVKGAMMKKHEEVADDTKKEAMRRFQGSRVKTAMEARAESEQPRRREVARSNDVIEEACTKLLAKRQGSRVRALVGAFETVMDAKPAAGKPQHHYRQSV